MKINVGAADRSVRIVVGTTLVSLAAAGLVDWWAYIGLVPLVTGLVGYCPLYGLFGFDTCAMRKRQAR